MGDIINELNALAQDGYNLSNAEHSGTTLTITFASDANPQPPIRTLQINGVSLEDMTLN